MRELESFLGSPEKKFIDGAEDQRYIVRLFAKNYIKAGTKVTKDMLTVKRADNGLLPYQLDSIIGAVVIRDIPADEPISKNLFSYSSDL